MDTRRVNILGVGISPVNLPAAVDMLLRAVSTRTKGYVCVTGVHGVIESQKDPELRRIHNQSLLTVPDGMPLVWAGHQQGFLNMGRVYGPDLMRSICLSTAQPNSSFKHFLFGATPDVLNKLADNLKQQCPGIHIAGQSAPPFRPLNTEEEKNLVEQVRRADPDFFWVGLSTPKQEKFMSHYIKKLDTRIMIGVGAAFDIHAGLKLDAPAWVKKSGMQWLHRLCQEPRRLWRRYLFIVPAFLILTTLQRLGLRRYTADNIFYAI